MDGVPDWLPGDTCPCGCGAISFKLNRQGHGSRVCRCRSCIGRRANQRGHRKQSRVLKDAAKAHGVTMRRAPTNEEWARFPFWHYESKSGERVPKALGGTFVRHAERQAELAAEGVARGWAVVFTLPDGRRRLWCDFETFLRFVSETEGDADVGEGDGARPGDDGQELLGT